MAVDMANIARKINPKAIIVAGGPHFSCEQEIVTALKNKEFDIIFRSNIVDILLI